MFQTFVVRVQIWADVWTSDVRIKPAILLFHLPLAISFLSPTKGHIKLPSPIYTYWNYVAYWKSGLISSDTITIFLSTETVIYPSVLPLEELPDNWIHTTNFILLPFYSMQVHEILLIKANPTHNINHLYLTVTRESNNTAPLDNGSYFLYSCS